MGHLISETCGELSKGYPFACTYFDTGNQRIYSLRRRDGETIDVSAIAKYIADTYSASDRIGKASGGGHAPAAGFSLPAFIRPESINIVIAQIFDDNQ